MPAIARIRFTNLVYENGAKRYGDEIFRFDGHNGVILLENGGGKTVLVQAILQTVLPHAALAERKAKDTFTLENSPAHIAVEWIINEKPRRYALTVVTLFSSKEGLDSYKYVYEYENGDEHSLEGLPLVRQGADGRLRPASKEEMYDYYQTMSRNYMTARYFARNREYQSYIEENFKIIISEWRSIARINSAEGEIEGFFEGCKTTTQLVDQLLIPTVEEAMAGGGTRDFVKIFASQRDHFKKHRQLRERIEESQRVDEEIRRYVEAYAAYDRAGQMMFSVKGKAKSLYELGLQERQRVEGELQQWQAASHLLADQQQELARQQAAYDLAVLQQDMEQAQHSWQERREEFRTRQEEYLENYRRLQNLKIARWREQVESRSEEMDYFQNQLENLEADRDVQELTARLLDNAAGLRFCYLRAEAELRSREERVKREEQDLRREIEDLGNRSQSLQEEYQELLIKRAQSQKHMELAKKEMEEIARRILANPLHDDLQQEKQHWEQRVQILEKSRQDNEQAEQQMKQEKLQVNQELSRLRRELPEAGREEQRLQTRLEQIEESQQDLLLRLQELYAEFSTLDSLYLHQHRIAEHLENRVAALREQRERALARDSQTAALFALYEPCNYYSADPQLAGWIEEWREQFSYLEAGTLWVQKAARQRGKEAAEYFQVYPFWALSIICRDVEADRLMGRLAKCQTDMTHPVYVLSQEEARQLIDQLEDADNDGPGLEIKRQVFPAGWQVNLSPSAFQDWKGELEKMAAAARAERLSREAGLQGLQEYYRQLQGFWRNHPYEEYDGLREEVRKMREVVVGLDQSLRALEKRGEEIDLRILHLQKQQEEQKEEISYLGQRLREANQYLRKAAEYDEARLNIEQDNELIGARGQDLETLKKELRRREEKLGQCQQSLYAVQADLSHLQGEELYREVEGSPPRATELNWSLLVQERQDLKDALQQKQKGRQIIEERLRTARREKEQLEKELSRSRLECEGLIDPDFVFPAGGDQEIDLLLPLVQAGKQKLDQLSPRLDRAEKEYTVRKDRYERQEEEYLRVYQERVFFADSLIRVHEHLEQEKSILQEQAEYLQKQGRKISSEQDLIKEALTILEQKNERYEYLLAEVSACQLPATVRQDFPYRPLEVIEQYVERLQQEQNELDRQSAHLEREKTRLEAFCQEQVRDVKLRGMVTDGLRHRRSYQEVWDWQTRMGERLAMTIRMAEDDMREHDRELQQFINRLHSFLQNIAAELRMIPRKTRVKVEEGWKEIFLFDVPTWQEKEGKAKLRAHVDWMIKQIESSHYRDEHGNEDYAHLHKDLQKWLQSQQLLGIVMNDKAIKVKCRKVTADGKVNSYPHSWESSNQWSGGEKWSKNMALFLGLLNYLAEKRQAIDSRAQRSRTVILDNPFGKASSDHVLDPVFFIAAQLGFQIIALTALAEGKFVREYFPLVYSCRLRPTASQDKYLVTTEQEIRYAYFQDHQPESLRRLGEHKQMELFGE